MAFENATGLNVYSSYGRRDSGGTYGSEQTQRSTREYSFAFTGASLASGYIPPLVIPRGAKLIRAILRVDEVFNVSSGGTLTFGGTVPGTNGIVLTEAELENVGTKTPTSTGTGTWAVASTTGTTAAEKVTRAISGTIASTQGKATLVLTFINKTKV